MSLLLPLLLLLPPLLLVPLLMMIAAAAAAVLQVQSLVGVDPVVWYSFGVTCVFWSLF
jgi:hypothetical protein